MSLSWLAALENVGTALTGAPASLVTAAQNELNAIMGGVKSKVTPMLNTITAEYTSPDVSPIWSNRSRKSGTCRRPRQFWLEPFQRRRRLRRRTPPSSRPSWES